MRKTMNLIAVFTILLLASISLGDESAVEQSLRLAVDLTDGSRIIGVPSGSSLRLKTAYAEMDIGLKHILSISVEAGNEIAVTQCRNGDTLRGVLELDELRMTTAIGEVSIPVQHVKTISVQGGDGPLATDKEHLVLYYSFDKDEGAEVSDLSGRGNHGDVHGAKWTNEGKVGGAYEFDGRAYIALANKRFLDGYADTTMCAWINCQLPPGQGGQILGSGDLRGGIDPVSTRINTRMFEDFGLCDTVNNRKVESVGEVGVHPGSWQMLAITLESDRAHSSYRVYLDGNVIDSRELPGGFSITYDEDMPTQIGSITGIQGWVGLIDEVMVFDRALSESEIKHLYLSGSSELPR